MSFTKLLFKYKALEGTRAVSWQESGTVPWSGIYCECEPYYWAGVNCSLLPEASQKPLPEGDGQSGRELRGGKNISSQVI